MNRGDERLADEAVQVGDVRTEISWSEEGAWLQIKCQFPNSYELMRYMDTAAATIRKYGRFALVINGEGWKFNLKG